MQPPRWAYVGALLLSLAGASFFYGKSQYAESNVSEKQFISPTITALASETPKPFAQIAPSTTFMPAKEEIYVVQRGDTLSAIARRYNTTIDAIASLNNIQNPSLIHHGQELKMPYSSAAPAAKSSYPTATPFAVDKYSERRPDSSVWEVQKMSDGSYKEKQVEPPHTPAPKPAATPTIAKKSVAELLKVYDNVQLKDGRKASVNDTYGSGPNTFANFCMLEGDRRCYRLPKTDAVRFLIKLQSRDNTNGYVIWDRIPNAARYRVRIGDLDRPIIDEYHTGTSINFSANLNVFQCNVSYPLRIEALDETGQIQAEGEWKMKVVRQNKEPPLPDCNK